MPISRSGLTRSEQDRWRRLRTLDGLAPVERSTAHKRPNPRRSHSHAVDEVRADGSEYAGRPRSHRRPFDTPGRASASEARNTRSFCIKLHRLLKSPMAGTAQSATSRQASSAYRRRCPAVRRCRGAGDDQPLFAMAMAAVVRPRHNGSPQGSSREPGWTFLQVSKRFIPIPPERSHE